MVYIVKFYRVLPTGKCAHGKTLEKYKEDDPNIPFDIKDPVSCYRYLKSKYANAKTVDKAKVAYRIYRWGGTKGVPRGTASIINFFPSQDRHGNELNLGTFGRLELFPKLYRELKDRERYEHEQETIKKERENKERYVSEDEL